MSTAEVMVAVGLTIVFGAAALALLSIWGMSLLAVVLSAREREWGYTLAWLASFALATGVILFVVGMLSGGL